MRATAKGGSWAPPSVRSMQRIHTWGCWTGCCRDLAQNTQGCILAQITCGRMEYHCSHEAQIRVAPPEPISVASENGCLVPPAHSRLQVLVTSRDQPDLFHFQQQTETCLLSRHHGSGMRRGRRTMSGPPQIIVTFIRMGLGFLLPPLRVHNRGTIQPLMPNSPTILSN
jgi:hypothetical protein